jgi:hypothetical protein
LATNKQTERLLGSLSIATREKKSEKLHTQVLLRGCSESVLIFGFLYWMGFAEEQLISVAGWSLMCSTCLILGAQCLAQSYQPTAGSLRIYSRQRQLLLLLLHHLQERYGK